MIAAAIIGLLLLGFLLGRASHHDKIVGKPVHGTLTNVGPGRVQGCVGEGNARHCGTIDLRGTATRVAVHEGATVSGEWFDLHNDSSVLSLDSIGG